MAIPATVSRIGTPASIRERHPPQTVAIEEDPLDDRMSETIRIGIGKGLAGRQNRKERPPRQDAVADFPPAGTPERFGLADAEGREIVVEKERAPLLAGDVVHPLLVMGGPQGHGHQGLRLAPVEEGRTVGAGQQTDLGADRPDFRIGAAVDSSVFLQNHLPEDSPLQRLDDLEHLGLEGGSSAVQASGRRFSEPRSSFA